MEKQKLKSFKSDIDREAAVTITVQNIGIASVKEIIDRIEKYGGKITPKQVEKACENLQKRQIFSIDLKERGTKRYLMRRIGVSVPEIGQIKAIVDANAEENVEIRALITELEASKKNAKIAPMDYYDVDVTFKTKGKVYGFVPNGNGVDNAHYREDGKVVFYKKHFRGWLRGGLPLANMWPNAISRIFVFNGTTNAPDKLPTAQQFVGNVGGTIKGAGRGDRCLEYLPEGTLIVTKFRIPAELFTPASFEKLIRLTGESVSFGGCGKMSNSQLMVEKYTPTDKIWEVD